MGELRRYDIISDTHGYLPPELLGAARERARGLVVRRAPVALGRNNQLV